VTASSGDGGRRDWARAETAYRRLQRTFALRARCAESRLNLRTPDARGRLTPPARSVFWSYRTGLFQGGGEQTLNHKKEVVKMETEIWQQLDAYLRLLNVIEARTRDRQMAAVVFAELAGDIRAGLIRQPSQRVDRMKADEDEPTTVVKLPPRIPR